MNLHAIGEISLNISTFIYFIWFIPQLFLTFKRRKTEGLSLWMHGILATGYMMDLMYGFGRHMAFQYRLVTIVGLCALAIEHYQFARFGLKKDRDKVTYALFTLFFALLLIFALYNISFATHSKRYYDIAGFLSSLCWFAFMWPQIIKNFINKSSEGLSVSFVLLAVFSGICDVIAAYALGWDWPSKVSAPIGLVKKSLLLSQCWYYKSKPRQLEAQYS